MKRVAYIIAFIGLLVSSQAFAAARFWVGGAGTWDNVTTTHWAATTGGAGGATVPASADDVTFDGASGGGAVTIAATINGSNTVNSITMDAFTGTLDASVNNPNLTMVFFSSNGSSIRTLSMGSGTWTITGTSGNPWYDSGSNMTLNSNTSTLRFTATAVSNRAAFLGGNMVHTYNKIIVDPDTSGFLLSFYCGNSGTTVTTFQISAPSYVELVNTLTVTNAIAWAGTSSSNAILLSGGGSIAVAAGSTLNWTAMKRMTFTGAPVATNSFDLKGNSGVTITGPSGGVAAGRIIGG